MQTSKSQETTALEKQKPENNKENQQDGKDASNNDTPTENHVSPNPTVPVPESDNSVDPLTSHVEQSESSPANIAAIKEKKIEQQEYEIRADVANIKNEEGQKNNSEEKKVTSESVSQKRPEIDVGPGYKEAIEQNEVLENNLVTFPLFLLPVNNIPPDLAQYAIESEEDLPEFLPPFHQFGPEEEAINFLEPGPPSVQNHDSQEPTVLNASKSTCDE